MVLGSCCGLREPGPESHGSNGLFAMIPELMDAFFYSCLCGFRILVWMDLTRKGDMGIDVYVEADIDKDSQFGSLKGVSKSGHV